MQLVQEVRDGVRGAIELPSISAQIEATLAGAFAGAVYAVFRKKSLVTSMAYGGVAGVMASYVALHVLKPSLHPELIANPNPSLLPRGGT